MSCLLIFENKVNTIKKIISAHTLHYFSKELSCDFMHGNPTPTKYVCTEK